MKNKNFKISNMDLNGASVLITGATGSFGQHCLSYLSRNFDLGRIVIFSRDELKQSEMQLNLDNSTSQIARFFIGDVRDRSRLEMAMRGIDIVIHAAALKQVITAEYNPIECIHTNILGAENIVHAAFANKVSKVIALSTDKATSPINLYGASKLASDKVFVAANHLSGESGTKFSVVRYGNVIGSRGSVIPLFKKMIEEGSDYLPITDKRMTRFWITLNQGVKFVLSCLGLMRGGEIFIPKIPSMSIEDIARTLAPNLKHRITGIRPGEKLHEMMITSEDSRTTLDLGDRYVIEPSVSLWGRKSFIDDGAIPVKEGFSYSSDTNESWLDKKMFLSMLDDM
ncbi:MAG: UDP-N-acetylglucosamine 4,6-dehydratase (inverting) [Alphaproteobacteria bacterium MarineAlpha2_Bin1]|nr:MAG: UDP-N-acetylglucosamine 4,6-dehydratase (inverting) [Alphaproteobacteria bacterium MarineAlpha2_Bin1]